MKRQTTTGYESVKAAFRLARAAMDRDDIALADTLIRSSGGTINDITNYFTAEERRRLARNAPTTDSESDLGDPNVPSRHELRMWEYMGGDQ